MKKIKKKTKKDFLYERKGPWPQPCPEHPFDAAPAVLKLPLVEALDWWVHIGSRYIKTLGHSPIAYLKGCINQGLEEVSDSEFEDIIGSTLLCQFVKNAFDAEDKKIFPELVKNPEKYLLFDMGPVKVVKTFEGMYVSATKTLFLKQKGKLKVLKIFVDETKATFTPNDSDNWMLAKFFALQGGALCSSLVLHPLFHFPTDSINAITKTSLPKDHILFQLLYPHLRFTLYLENAVLTFQSSLLMSKWWMPYAPYPGPAKGLRKLLTKGYQGMKKNASFNEFKFNQKPDFNETRYSQFLKSYYEVIHDFIDKLLVDLTEDELFYLKHWANYLHQYVKGFPTATRFMKDREIQVDYITHYLWTITVAHSLDHYSFGKLDIRKIPLRLREAPPKENDTKKINLKSLTRFWDNGKYEMANILFFKPSLVTSLINTKYDFKERNKKLQPIVKEFKENLKKLDKKLKKDKMQFIPLEEIAASIQY